MGIELGNVTVIMGYPGKTATLMKVEEDLIGQGYRTIFIPENIMTKSQAKIDGLKQLIDKMDSNRAVLLLDEFDQGMHPVMLKKMVELLIEAVRKGIKVVLTTDNLGLLTLIACMIPDAKLYILENGKLEEYSIASSAIPTYTEVYLQVCKGGGKNG